MRAAMSLDSVEVDSGAGRSNGCRPAQRVAESMNLREIQCRSENRVCPYRFECTAKFLDPKGHRAGGAATTYLVIGAVLWRDDEEPRIGQGGGRQVMIPVPPSIAMRQEKRRPVPGSRRGFKRVFDVKGSEPPESGRRPLGNRIPHPDSLASAFKCAKARGDGAGWQYRYENRGSQQAP